MLTKPDDSEAERAGMLMQALGNQYGMWVTWMDVAKAVPMEGG